MIRPEIVFLALRLMLVPNFYKVGASYSLVTVINRT